MGCARQAGGRCSAAVRRVGWGGLRVRLRVLLVGGWGALWGAHAARGWTTEADLFHLLARVCTR